MEYEISTITTQGLIFTLLASALMVVLPRRLASIPIIITGCFITIGQILYLSGLHFTVTRIIVLVGWARILLRREYKDIEINKVDKALLLWVLSSVVIYNIQFQTFDAFINRLGFLYNSVGIYFLFRCLIRDMNDAMLVLKMLILVSIPLTILILFEKSSGYNIFSIFGGVPEYTVIRDGRLRCQGPFRHPILAGTFGATLMPLFVGLFIAGKSRIAAFIGVIASSIITIAAASSGPVLAYLSGMIALLMYPLRNKMRVVRWCVVFGLVLLHFYMKAPIWYIIARISELIGGTGWHRSYLVDQALSHIDEWWLFGTHYTAHWIPWVLPINPDMVDITNRYIYEGLTGGMVTLILFVTLVAICFQTIGQSIAININDKGMNYIRWSIGASLFAHVMSFMSVVYFDQMELFWFLLLSLIAVNFEKLDAALVKLKH